MHHSKPQVLRTRMSSCFDLNLLSYSMHLAYVKNVDYFSKDQDQKSSFKVCVLFSFYVLCPMQTPSSHLKYLCPYVFNLKKIK